MADSNKTYFGSPSEIRRRMMMTAKTGGGGYPQPIALQTDGLAYINLPMSMQEFAQKNPKLVLKVDKDAPYLNNPAGFIKNGLIVGYGNSETLLSAIYGKYLNSPGKYATFVALDQTARDINIDIGQRIESYIVWNSHANYTCFAKPYGSEEDYASSNIFSYQFNKATRLQIFSGIKISLYSLVLDDMNLVPHFNGTEYGLLDTMSGIFYGNDNTEGEFIPIFEEE